tara:strand:+ start:651 stop:920 length:270 start_codon:yes stop_codon:yes gene_type:complete
MKYFIFLFFFLFLNLEKKEINYFCKKSNTLILFNKVEENYILLDKYNYKINKIAFFKCKERNCELKKVIKNKVFISSSSFFDKCERKIK